MSGPARVKYFFGAVSPGTLWDATQNTPSKDLAAAVQGITGGVLFRIKTGTRNGSGVMDADIEDSDDNLNWNTVASFTQITAAGSYTKNPALRIRRFARLKTTLTSGTSFSDTRMWCEYQEDRNSGAVEGGAGIRQT